MLISENSVKQAFSVHKLWIERRNREESNSRKRACVLSGKGYGHYN